MQIYLVGGAVRDALLGLPVHERDWVVVGATAEQLLAAGYLQVGRDFPVFLHPETKEEYALARTERKVAAGYRGFEVHADPGVTLDEDLARRDLTINAIAQDGDGKLYDPFHGQADLQARILRHVSPAFSEDPVRVLRLARFAARFADFSVAADTMQLLQAMVQAGEVDATVPERVWRELVRALAAPAAWRFFEVLQQAGALAVLMPEFAWQADSLARLQRICAGTQVVAERWAAILADLNPQAVQAINQRLAAPVAFRDLALLVARHTALIETADKASPEQLLALWQACDVARRPERLPAVVASVAAASAQDITSAQRRLTQAMQVIGQVSVKPLLAQGLQGKDLATALQQARLQALNRLAADD